MILSAKSGLRGVLVRRDTSERVPLAFWADTDSGRFLAYRTLDGKTPLRGPDGRPLVYEGHGPLAFVASGAALPASKPTSALDLAGSLEEARHRYIKVIPEVPGQECMESRCHRLATYEVADEQEVLPQIAADGLSYERALTLRVRRYCHFHWQAPTFTTLRGVQSAVDVNVRPQ